MLPPFDRLKVKVNITVTACAEADKGTEEYHHRDTYNYVTHLLGETISLVPGEPISALLALLSA